MTPPWAERLKLRQLRAILAIDEHGSVTLAAESLFVTQAAVSKTVAEVEAQIGTALFERKGRGIVATGAGRHVIGAARRIAMELKALSDEVDLVVQGGAGTLTIGMQAVSIVHILPEIIAAMSIRYPRINIRLQEDALSNIVRDLRAGRIDLAFGRMLPHLLGTDLDGLRMPHIPYVVVASVGHPLLTDPAPSWESALAQSWILPMPGTPVRSYIADFLAERHLALPDCRIETPSMSLLGAILRATPRLAFLPVNVAEAWQQAGDCAICPLELPLRMEPLGLIWSRATPISPSARVFRAMTRAHLDDAPDWGAGLRRRIGAPAATA